MNFVFPILIIIVLIAVTDVTQAQYNRAVPYPVAYNLQSRQTPGDVNDLSAEYVQRAMKDVKTTISEVQRVLAHDPSLPRLTRGEVEELFENVTREEYEKSLYRGDHNRAKHMRALMLVLPYNANNVSSADSMEELYRKPPVTRLVNTGAKPKQQPQPIQFDPESGATKIVPLPTISTTTYRPVKKTIGNKPTKAPTKPPGRDRLSVTTFNPNAQKHKYSSHFSVNAAPFSTQHTNVPQAQPLKLEPIRTTHSTPMRDNVKGMLASIGLVPEREGQGDAVPSQPPVFKKVSKIELPIFIQPIVPVSPKRITTTTTTTTPQPPASELTPEMRNLLKSFGLLKEEPGTATKFGYTDKPIQFEGIEDVPNVNLKSPFDEYNEFVPLPQSASNVGLHSFRLTPEIVPDDFSSFKPIQIGNHQSNEEYDTELENLLKSFGLINNKRTKKSMLTGSSTTTTEEPSTTVIPSSTTVAPMKEMPPVFVDMLSNNMASILDNLGVSTIKNHNFDGKKPRRIGSTNAQSFRPAAHSKSDEDDYAKLNQLLETIKQLDSLNSNLTEEDISKLNLKHFNLSESLLSKGPDPLEHVEQSQLKNEIKRQDGNDPIRISLNGGDDKTSTTSTTTTTTEKSEETTTASISDKLDDEASTTLESVSEESPRSDSGLEDSFGGGADPVTQEPLPPPRRNGFYFLQDFNSFLEVGEDPDKVDVRYERKFGDPSRFIKVTVP